MRTHRRVSTDTVIWTWLVKADEEFLGYAHVYEDGWWNFAYITRDPLTREVTVHAPVPEARFRIRDVWEKEIGDRKDELTMRYGGWVLRSTP